MPDISPTQIKLIHIGNSSCKISAEEHMAHCIEFGAGLDEWTASSKHLNYDQASRLIDHLKAAHGFEIKARKDSGRAEMTKRPKGITGLPTPGQVKYLDALGSKVSWRVPDGFERLCTKIIKKRRPTTSREAARMIECLKGMLSLKAQKDSGQAGMTKKEEAPF